MLGFFERFTLYSRFRAFFDSGAWIMIVLGLVLFSLRTPFTDSSFVNLPVAASVFQILGLIFTVAGFTIFLSIMMWHQINVTDLLNDVLKERSSAAGLVLLGLLVFNGLTFFGSVVLLNEAFGG